MNRVRWVTAYLIDTFLMVAVWVPLFWSVSVIRDAYHVFTFDFGGLPWPQTTWLVLTWVFAILASVRLATRLRWPLEY